jgi:hypothetical protein
MPRGSGLADDGGIVDSCSDEKENHVAEDRVRLLCMQSVYAGV